LDINIFAEGLKTQAMKRSTRRFNFAELHKLAIAYTLSWT